MDVTVMKVCGAVPLCFYGVYEVVRTLTQTQSYGVYEVVRTLRLKLTPKDALPETVNSDCNLAQTNMQLSVYQCAPENYPAGHPLA